MQLHCTKRQIEELQLGSTASATKSKKVAFSSLSVRTYFQCPSQNMKQQRTRRVQPPQVHNQPRLPAYQHREMGCKNKKNKRPRVSLIFVVGEFLMVNRRVPLINLSYKFRPAFNLLGPIYNWRKVEGSLAHPNYPGRANFSYISLQIWRTVYMRNKKLARLEGWSSFPRQLFFI